ncbi:MAG: hypothetical protein LBQ76_06555 [Candidatus Fibromonas sp.]|jgi:hypothetical protein|nr:hypothetical protein [Candidatus Fibromonas sp.]
MLDKRERGKIFSALVLVFFGFSFAQELLSPDSVPQGFAVQAAQVSQVSLDPKTIANIPPPSSAKTPYRFYEDYLDTMMILARDIVPGKEKYEVSRSQINEEKPEPKGEYESQSRYDRRIANFDNEKQKKLRNLESKYEAEERKRTKKLKEAANFSKDLQPEWAGILKKDTTAEGYQNRRARLKDKISAMEKRAAEVNETLAGLDLLSEGELEDVEKKSLLYLARLEMACELMQDYILQDYSRVLNTGRKNFGMALGDYNPDMEEFEFTISDANSLTVPFEYAGIIKVSPAQAQAIDRKTDDFLASVDYINYPLITQGEKLYPGVKKAYIFYKEREFPNTGFFKNVAGIDVTAGYAEWAVFADSLISGKLKPQLLDSSYAMKKVRVGPPFWNAKRILRATAFALSATSLGIGIWQNQEAKIKAKNANTLYAQTLNAAKAGNAQSYGTSSKAYEKKVDSMHSSEYLRNGLYVSAGIFGVAGLVTFFF